MPGFTSPYDLEKDARKRGLQSAGTGALGGAASGAAAGTAFLPGIGTAVGALGGAVIGGIGGALGAKRSQTEKLRDELLQKEANAAEAGQLGLTDSEKARITQDETQAAGSRIQAQQAEISRQQLANGGGFSGNYAALQRDLAGRESESAASASRAAEEASRAQEARRYAQLSNDLAARADTQAQQQMMARQSAMNSVQAGLGVIGSAMDAESLQALLDGLGGVDMANLSAQEQAVLQKTFEEQFGLTGDIMATGPSTGDVLA